MLDDSTTGGVPKILCGLILMALVIVAPQTGTKPRRTNSIQLILFTFPVLYVKSWINEGGRL